MTKAALARRAQLASYDDELAYEIKSNRGLRSRLSALCQGQGGKGHRVSIFNETHDVVSLVALPGSTLFSRTKGVAAGGFLEAVVGQWKTNKLKTFDRNDTVAFQVPPGQRCSVKQWDGTQDIVVLVATFGKSRYEEHGGDFEPDERSLLSVWAKLRCNVGATVFLYPGLFHPNMRPLFGRHVLDENTPAAHVIVDVVLPRESPEGVVESRVALTEAGVEQREMQTKGAPLPMIGTGVEADMDAMAVEREQKVVDESGYEQYSGEVVEPAKPVVSEKAKRTNVGGYEQVVQYSGEVVKPAKAVVNENAKDSNIGGFEQVVKQSGEVVEPAKVVVSEKAKDDDTGQPAKEVVVEKAKDGNIGMGRFSNYPGMPELLLGHDCLPLPSAPGRATFSDYGGGVLRVILSFLPGISLCQCLPLNRALRQDVKEFVSTMIVADPEAGEAWTVPMDVLKLELGDSPRLVSADYGVTIEGLEESLQQLNALIVPAPLILEIDGATYFSLSPVLRCRWKGKAREGKWRVRFAMFGVEGLSSNFSHIVSVSRRPSASNDWELVHSMGGTEQDLLGTEQDSGGTETVETVCATVTHFSDLVPVVSKSTAEQESDGYIIQPRYGRSLFSSGCKTVHLHNASKGKLGFHQYWPLSAITARDGGLELNVLGTGGGASRGKEVTVFDPEGYVTNGYVVQWPRDTKQAYIQGSHPFKELNTQHRGMSVRVAVWKPGVTTTTGTTTSTTKIEPLVKFGCDAGTRAILLENVVDKSPIPTSINDQVREAFGI